MNLRELILEVRHLKEVLYIELNSRDKARELQAAEYERRLETLNHENERILNAQNAAVSNEKFDGFVKAYEQWRAGIDAYVNSAEGNRSGIEKKQANLRQLVVVTTGIATVVISVVVMVANGFLGGG